MIVEIIRRFPIKEITKILTFNPNKSKTRGITITMLRITIKSMRNIFLSE
jgi:hypothetical protein